jgi:hypothetical protein
LTLLLHTRGRIYRRSFGKGRGDRRCTWRGGVVAAAVVVCLEAECWGSVCSQSVHALELMQGKIRDRNGLMNPWGVGRRVGRKVGIEGGWAFHCSRLKTVSYLCLAYICCLDLWGLFIVA